MRQRIKNFLFKNTTAKQTVAKNTTWLTISNFGGRAIKAVIIIYAARLISTSSYGVFSYAITLAGFFTFFVDPGLNNILMRESAKTDDAKSRQLFSTVFLMKIVLIAGTVLFVVFVGPSFSTLPGAAMLLPIAALVIATDPMRDFFSALLRSREKMEWEAGIFLLTNVVIVVAGFVFLKISPTASALLWGYATGTAVGALVAAWVVRDYLKDCFSRASRSLMGPILKAAWPFAITSVLGSLLTSADVFIVSWLRDASDVGIWSAAVRIVQVLYLLPMIFQFSTLPLLSRLANRDNARFRSVLERTIRTLYLISVPIALGGLILGTQIMELVFGVPYGPGGAAFKVLMLTLLFDFPLAVISNAIFAYDRQKVLIVSATIAGVTNVCLDLLLIPIFGITGSAIATLIAQIATNWYLWTTMNKINHFEIVPHLGKIAIAGVAMAASVVVLFLAGANVVVNILLGTVIYFGILALLREPILFEAKSVIFPQSTEATP